jgi:hypothetical protein
MGYKLETDIPREPQSTMPTTCRACGGPIENIHSLVDGSRRQCGRCGLRPEEEFKPFLQGMPQLETKPHDFGKPVPWLADPKPVEPVPLSADVPEKEVLEEPKEQPRAKRK